eukprot:3213888-Prymnesium_polylepis.1
MHEDLHLGPEALPLGGDIDPVLNAQLSRVLDRTPAVEHPPLAAGLAQLEAQLLKPIMLVVLWH